MIDQSLKKYMSDWAKLTFKDGLNLLEYELHNMHNFVDSSDIKTLGQTDFYHQLVSEKRLLDGNSVMGLRNRYEDKMGIILSKYFQECVQVYPLDYLPIIFCLRIVHELKKLGDNTNLISGKLVRAYAAFFPSLLRDFDFFHKMRHLIRSKKPYFSCNIRQDDSWDVYKKADVVLDFEFKQRKIRFIIWLFFISGNERIGSTKWRMRGKRSKNGKLPSGYHIFAPLRQFYEDKNENLKAEDFLGWKLYSEEYVERVFEICIDIFENRRKFGSYEYYLELLENESEYHYPLDEILKDQFIKKTELIQPLVFLKDRS